MTDANEMYDSNMNYLVCCDTDDDTKEEQDNFSLYEEAEIVSKYSCWGQAAEIRWINVC